MRLQASSTAREPNGYALGCGYSGLIVPHRDLRCAPGAALRDMSRGLAIFVAIPIIWIVQGRVVIERGWGWPGSVRLAW